MLPTPAATSYGSSDNGVLRHGGITPSGSIETPRPSAGTPSLETMARKNLWPTPRAQDSKHAAATEWELSTDHAGTKDSLRVQVVKQAWPTPHGFSKDGRSNGPSGNELGHAVNAEMRKNLWPTPTAHNAKETNAPSETDRNTPTLAAQAGGSLNPDWVAWLMGWPPGWIDLEPIDTLEWLPFDPEPAIPRTAIGVPNRVKKLKALGNGQVPQCAALAWRILTQRLDEQPGDTR